MYVRNNETVDDTIYVDPLSIRALGEQHQFYNNEPTIFNGANLPDIKFEIPFEHYIVKCMVAYLNKEIKEINSRRIYEPHINKELYGWSESDKQQSLHAIEYVYYILTHKSPNDFENEITKELYRIFLESFGCSVNYIQYMKQLSSIKCFWDTLHKTGYQAYTSQLNIKRVY